MKFMVGIKLLQDILNANFLQFLPLQNKTDPKHAIAVAPSMNTIIFHQTQFMW